MGLRKSSEPWFMRERLSQTSFLWLWGGCALSKTCSLHMQCALNENMGFGVLWTWVQILIPAWIGCVILSKFYELCKPVSSFKVGRKIITSTAWNEVLSHMQSTYCRTKHLLRAQYTFIWKGDRKDTNNQQHRPLHCGLTPCGEDKKIPNFG